MGFQSHKPHHTCDSSRTSWLTIHKHSNRTSSSTKHKQGTKITQRYIKRNRGIPWALRIRKILLPVTLFTWAIPWESRRITPIWDGDIPFFANLQMLSSTLTQIHVRTSVLGLSIKNPNPKIASEILGFHLLTSGVEIFNQLGGLLL